MEFHEVDGACFSDRALARRGDHEALLKAYRAAHYEVEPPAGFTLRVDTPSAELRKGHAAMQVHSSAFVSAWNPLSRPTPDVANAAAHARLLDETRRRGFAIREGQGRDPSNAWSAERSLLIFGISLADAVALGERFEQAAILWSAADATPRLYVLDLP